MNMSRALAQSITDAVTGKAKGTKLLSGKMRIFSVELKGLTK